MKIVFDDGIYKDLNNYIQFDSMNNKTIKEDYKYIIPKQLIIEPIIIEKNKLVLDNGIVLKTFSGDHHKDCYGLKVINGDKSFAITGDTIATKGIEKACFDCDFVFHDFFLPGGHFCVQFCCAACHSLFYTWIHLPQILLDSDLTMILTNQRAYFAVLSGAE